MLNSTRPFVGPPRGTNPPAKKETQINNMHVPATRKAIRNPWRGMTKQRQASSLFGPVPDGGNLSTSTKYTWGIIKSMIIRTYTPPRDTQAQWNPSCLISSVRTERVSRSGRKYCYILWFDRNCFRARPKDGKWELEAYLDRWQGPPRCLGNKTTWSGPFRLPEMYSLGFSAHKLLEPTHALPLMHQPAWK